MNIASYIDHTILYPQTQQAQIDQLCNEAIQYHFAAVCIAPCYVKRAARLLHLSPVRIATVIGFPLGYNHSKTKMYEMKQALKQGAQEIDMVINIGALKDKRWNYLHHEIKSLCQAAHYQGAIIKVIIETALLSNQEITQICDMCAQTQVDFVKTSTGFSTAGATLEHINLMRQVLSPSIAIKASGGIKTRHFAEQLIHAGATRLGTSSGIAIMQEK